MTSDSIVTSIKQGVPLVRKNLGQHAPGNNRTVILANVMTPGRKLFHIGDSLGKIFLEGFK